jgi:LDH2 family malate/lactate/ureidoglycolate dehydrogenase
MDYYAHEVEQLVEFLKSSPLAPGFNEILVPGEIESRQRQERRAGIEVDEKTWAQIVECGKGAGIDITTL